MTYGCMVKLQCNKIMTKYAKQSFLKTMPKIKHFISVNCWKRKNVITVINICRAIVFFGHFSFLKREKKPLVIDFNIKSIYTGV